MISASDRTGPRRTRESSAPPPTHVRGGRFVGSHRIVSPRAAVSGRAMSRVLVVLLHVVAVVVDVYGIYFNETRCQ